MNVHTTSFLQSTELKLGFKLFIIFFIMLALLIPLGLIGSISRERKDRALQTENEIIGMNGGRPSIIGPFLIVPVTIMTRDDKNLVVATRSHAVILADTLNVTGNFATEMRNRGIYKVPLFSGNVRLEADFSHIEEKLDLGMWGQTYTADWANAWYSLELMDKRSIKSTPMLSLNDASSVAMKNSESAFGWTGSSVRAKADISNANISGGKMRVAVSLGLGGGGSLKVYPFGETVSCTIVSDWKAPSFTGYALPIKSELTDSGFNAAWFIPDTAQPYPPVFIAENNQMDFESASFGVDFYQPISIYHKTERALKYGFLFIIVPFVVFFLFEIFLRRRIHPLQYALIGFADVLFYLILLSFSEHIPFMAAYACGAFAVCLLVSFYSSAILGSWKRSLIMIPVLGGIYLYLYVALESEDFALLVGTVGVFAILACFMALTRKVDWYSLSFASKKET